MKLTVEAIREELGAIDDPEMGLSIVELGLVRDIQLSQNHVQVMLTLTSPICPWGPALVSAVRACLAELAAPREAVVELVWDPPWDPRTDASPEAQAELGLW